MINLVSFRGRGGMVEFILGAVLCMSLLTVAGVLSNFAVGQVIFGSIDSIFADGTGSAALAFYAAVAGAAASFGAFVWVTSSIIIRRLHDLGVTGWAALAPLVVWAVYLVASNGVSPDAMTAWLSGIVLFAIYVMLGITPSNPTNNAHGEPSGL